MELATMWVLQGRKAGAAASAGDVGSWEGTTFNGAGALGLLHALVEGLSCLQADLRPRVASKEALLFPADRLFWRRGSSRLLAGEAKQGLEAKIETHWAVSGRGLEFCWMAEASSEPLLLTPVCLLPLGICKTSRPMPGPPQGERLRCVGGPGTGEHAEAGHGHTPSPGHFQGCPSASGGHCPTTHPPLTFSGLFWVGPDPHPPG